MPFNYAAARNAQATHDRQVAQFQIEAEGYRERATLLNDEVEKQSCLDAARTLETQAEQARQRSQELQREMEAARDAERKLTFEQMMAQASEHGNKRGRGDEGMEL